MSHTESGQAKNVHSNHPSYWCDVLKSEKERQLQLINICHEAV